VARKPKKHAKPSEHRGRGKPKKWTEEVINHLADELLVWAHTGPRKEKWLGSFAVAHNLWLQRLSEFAEVSPYFAEALKVAKEVQTAWLVKKGMSRSCNASMCIFALKNVAGYRDDPGNNDGPENAPN
jgi:hypothetical protein